MPQGIEKEREREREREKGRERGKRERERECLRLECKNQFETMSAERRKRRKLAKIRFH